MKVDYSLYLVTDSTQGILGDRDLTSVVQAAVEGGVTVVQYRDKTSGTAELIRTAKKLHQVTKAASIPLLINDRLDVALAMGAEGVHIGQDDIDLPTARRLLGKAAIIGVTANSVQEAVKAVEDGADYLGIGTVYATPTKEDTKSIIGPAGVRDILTEIAAISDNVATVCIGGINASNIQRVLYQSQSRLNSLDGVAVVSAIMASSDPTGAARTLRSLIATQPLFATIQASNALITNVVKIEGPRIIQALVTQSPLCHNMTNLVVQNFAANVALAIGASPIMSNNGAEAADLAKLGGSLVVNMGTVTSDGLSNYLQALRAYNAVGGPTLFDPVGAGATQQRRDAVKTLMAGGYFDVIKGNEGEIKTVAGMAGAQQRGVDSGASTLSLEEKARLVQQLATRERNIVLMTGKVDVISDGRRTYAISNGHELLGSITGSGCTLGTTIASVLAVHRSDKLLAAVTGILLYEIAAEQAVSCGNAHGPGTFIPAFLDRLYHIRTVDVPAGTGFENAKIKNIIA
ncbi:Hydroxyethylthiazole kinase [Pseudovirgaria hyperparasitica]|uniref:Hydroxyethylthiazole kinase n=1 Tax=Pseudovirgaria hyperparasitica TaxID=470096 RepID=A0A6A6WMV3_9PEZI|nr:Hydroxyethylthiazole kinase [Pseudovirgaria hyperparasitica]KAF2763560.1 Hydroxyethylthiazole kinase [Pseudovirgaria hyperparasitica]